MDSGTYVRVKEETNDKLVLVREPSSRAWAILIGIVSLGVGATWYINDYLIWKLAYISGMLFVGVSCFEDWEECEFDKSEEKVKITKTTLFQKLVPAKEKKIMSAQLQEITSVSVEEESVRFGGKGYIVVLRFAGGYTLGVTETATMGNRSEHEQIATKISNFLDLGNVDNISSSEDETVSSTFEKIPKSVPSAPSEVAEEVKQTEEKKDITDESSPLITSSDLSDITSANEKAFVDESSTDNKEPGEEKTPKEPVTVETIQPTSGNSSSDESFEKIDEADLPSTRELLQKSALDDPEVTQSSPDQSTKLEEKGDGDDDDAKEPSVQAEDAGVEKESDKN